MPPPDRRPIALTIAGTDSGGGAGVVADVRTFVAHGVWPAVAVTAVTAQNTSGVDRVEPLEADVIGAQIGSVIGDLGADAVKIGMLGTEAAVRAVADALAGSGVGPIVVDPVLRSSTGTDLLPPEGWAALRSDLLPLAAVVTPNLAEAAALADLRERVTTEAGMVDAGRKILETGARAVLVTGGHLPGERAADCLLTPTAPVRWFVAPRVTDAAGTHGSGCVLAAAIAARLALGEDLADACAGAKRYVTAAITGALRVGRGAAAVDPPTRA